MIYVMEAILFLSIVTTLGMIMRTRNMYNGQNKLNKGIATTMQNVSPHHDYLWKTRELSLKSWIGYPTLLVGMTNYVCSMVYIREYVKYNSSVEDNELDAIKCEIAGSWVIVSYCSLFQVMLGSLTVLLFVLSFLLKACHAIGFAFPMITTRFKKSWWGIPRDFGHYANEFDFRCDESEL